MGRLLRAAGTIVVDSRRIIAALLLVFTCATAALFGRFEFESDLATLFPADHEAVSLRRLVAGDLTATENLLVIVHGDDIARRLPTIVARLEQSPHLVSVVATKEQFLGTTAAVIRNAPVPFLPTDVLEALRQRLCGPDREQVLDELEARIAEDPLLGLELARRDPLRVREVMQDYAQAQVPASFDASSPFLLLKDRRTAFLRLQGRYRSVDLDKTHELLDDIEERLSDVDHQLVGAHVIARATEAQLRQDLIWSMTGACILISLFLVGSTRRRLDPVILMVPCGVVLVWALGLGGLLFGPLTPLATGAAAVLAGLNVDFGIHFVGRFREERRRRDVRAALIETSARAGVPLAISMATTVVAFSSLGLSNFHGLWTFGALLALGVLLSFVSALSVIPLLLFGTMGSGAAAVAQPRQTSSVIRAAQSMLGSRSAIPILVVMLLVAGAGWTAALRGDLSFDADTQRLRRSDDPMIAAAREIEEQLQLAPFPIAVLIPATTPLAACQAGFQELEQQGAIASSLGIHRAMPTPAGVQRAADFRGSVGDWVPDVLASLNNRGFVAAAFRDTLEELATLLQRDPLPLDPEMRTWQGTDYWLFHVLATHTPWTPEARRILESAIADAIPGTKTVTTMGLADELTEILTSDLVRCGLFAAIGVLLIVFVLVRGKVLALIALTPTLAAVGLVFGYLVWTGAPIHLGNVVVLPFLIGLGIDDGVHMVVRYREELRHGSAQDVAILAVLASSGTAVWRTSVTTFLGFGSLVFAGSPALQSLGALMALGIATCFVTSIVIIPRLLQWVPSQQELRTQDLEPETLP
ncbi:MAG: MMPL family transporter [Planctomycetota bacterium]